MSNPKFLNVEKRVPYTVRLPKRLIDYMKLILTSLYNFYRGSNYFYSE